MEHGICYNFRHNPKKKLGAHMILTEEYITQQLNITQQTPKTFVFDLDGTLIYQGRPLEKAFEQALKDIQQAGHRIIFATGRSYRDFVPVLPDWCTDLPAVLFGGGLVLEEGIIRHQRFLAADDLNEVVTSLEDNKVNYLVDGHRSYYHPPCEHWLFDDIVKISGQLRDHTLDTIASDGAYKIMVLDDQWLEYFSQKIAPRELIIKHHSYDRCFDILPAKVNKYLGLSELTLPLSQNIFIFGNDLNDLELFQEFPNSIMFGAHPQLQKYAKLQIAYDDNLMSNFLQIINTILKK
jgi:hypothetical protein